ncbi:MAG: metallophosphoesterase family protein [Spirochaetota bacterium]|nr:metallophosphoesterase family protein [Spirochaetota bacterium]
MLNIINGSIGLISDSHSLNLEMRKAIEILYDMGAKNIIHLGDICDSLKPETLEDSIYILNRYNVKPIMGNNEYIIMTDQISSQTRSLKDTSISFLKELPYTIQFEDICFTHSLPLNWPAATHKPISEYLPKMTVKNPPFRRVFRGHSHKTSMIEIEYESQKELLIEPGARISLKKDRVYIITVGAVEDGLCSLYDPKSNEFITISIN